MAKVTPISFIIDCFTTIIYFKEIIVMTNYSKEIDAINLARERLEAKHQLTIQKALASENPNDIVKASKEYERLKGDSSAGNQPHAYFIDPLQFNSNLGYKDKEYSLSYETLRRMAKTPIINSIIKTRVNQIADFAEPQENKYSTGFVIRKKSKGGLEQEMSEKDKKIAFAITEFLLRGGSENTWERDDFDSFIRKIVNDSLVFDQMTFEVVRNRRGAVNSFIATDASTFRISESLFKKDYDNPYFKKNGSYFDNDDEYLGQKINGYYPSYVQIYQSTKVNSFYPWELCFGVRNPSTSVYANGYGCSELEDLINVITSMLWGDEYNRRFFSQGSAPKGMIRVKGSNNENALQQFKQQWQSMISGVMQSWKTPVVDADIEWIDLQKNNKDMEYSSWMEYLIKIACAVYSIDPTEIGWDISRSSGGGLFEGNQEQRLQHSKDKGLYPLLKFLQRKINKYIVESINPDFEFVFMGLNGMTIVEELDMDIKKLSNFATLNEIRQKYEMKPMENGDIPLNSIYVQNSQNAAADAMTVQNNEQENEGEDQGTQQTLFNDVEEKAQQNTLLKAFDNFLKEEENEYK